MQVLQILKINPQGNPEDIQEQFLGTYQASPTVIPVSEEMHMVEEGLDSFVGERLHKQ
jgi:hypothetical protein